MKWRFEFELEDGNDEFWESKPSKKEVYELVMETLKGAHLYIDGLKITCVIDDGHYTLDNWIDDTETDLKGK
jgi:hypothetical protein